MPRRGGRVHVATIKTKGKGGKQYTSYLLRRSYREGGKVRHENLGNLSHLPLAVIEAIRKMLAGRVLVDLDEQLQIESSRPHGHVAAVLGVLRSLDLERLLARERCAERDLVVAMICQLVIAPCSKLSMTRRFSQTTLADELSLGEVTEPELLQAMDWLLDRQKRVEKALARRYLSDGGFVLYDLSCSYVEGRCCPLAALGHSRDGKPGKLQVNWGLVCSPEGRPVAVQVHPGNTADPTTVPDVIDTIKQRFGIERVILVGDRAMITDAHAMRSDVCQLLNWRIRVDAFELARSAGTVHPRDESRPAEAQRRRAQALGVTRVGLRRGAHRPHSIHSPRWRGRPAAVHRGGH